MSTKITTLYDDIVTRMVALFPSHQRLSNAYKIEENPEVFLNQGWGLSIGEAENPQRDLSCNMSILRNIKITLTRKFYALENDGAAKATTEKNLFEDQYLLISDVEKTPAFGSTAIANLRFLGDDGIEYVSTETERFLKLSTRFDVLYFENLN